MTGIKPMFKTLRKFNRILAGSRRIPWFRMRRKPLLTLCAPLRKHLGGKRVCQPEGNKNQSRTLSPMRQIVMTNACFRISRKEVTTGISHCIRELSITR